MQTAILALEASSFQVEEAEAEHQGQTGQVMEAEAVDHIQVEEVGEPEANCLTGMVDLHLQVTK